MTHPKEEKTYIMIKPDGVRKGLIGEIISRLERRDMKIVALEMFQRPIRGVDPIRAVVGELPLVVIPTIKFDKSLKKPWFPAFWRFGSIKRLTSSAGE